MSRAVSPVVGVVTLLAMTIVLSATLLGATAVDLSTPGPIASLDLTADASADRIELVHRGGETLDISTLRVKVSVDGDPLDYQPPVPFFAAKGFRSGPEGAFNPASSNRLQAGEQTSFAVASTNAPEITSGATVSVTLFSENRTLLEVETTAT